MNPLKRLFGSSLGKKYIMALTGAMLFVFVVGHLAGNLQVFMGREPLNTYGHFLQSKAYLLWSARIGLLVLVLLHIWSAVQLSAENKKARPQNYAVFNPTVASYASRTMLMSGLIVLAFIIYHLLHFTVQVPAVNLIGSTQALPGGNFHNLVDPLKRHDVFAMMVIGFSNVWVSAFYVVAVALLCLHLSHGLSSMLQSMGWKRQPIGSVLDKLAKGVSLVIFLGYAAIPVAILLGYGRSAL